MFTAFLDSCVLVPVALCDTLLRTAECGLFRPVWSSGVLSEVGRALQRVHPDVARSRIDYRLREMDRSFPDAKVEPQPDPHARIGLPDPQDEHVLSAALKSRSDVIVTANLKDFPERILAPLGIAAVGPDDFLLDQLDLSEALVLRVLTEQAAAPRRPSLTMDDVLVALARAGAPNFAEAVRQANARPA